MIGDVEISWATLDAAFRGISPRHMTLQSCLARAAASGVIDKQLNWGRPLNHYSLWNFAQLTKSNNSIFPVQTTAAKFHEPTRRLYTILRGTASAACHDDRDRIYGVLGLCDDSIQAGIPIDYTTPVSVLFSQVTFRLISGLKTLSILTDKSLELCFRVPPSIYVPSWVPQQRNARDIVKIDCQDNNWIDLSKSYGRHHASLGA